jgi:hypothetical protein
MASVGFVPAIQSLLRVGWAMSAIETALVHISSTANMSVKTPQHAKNSEQSAPSSRKEDEAEHNKYADEKEQPRQKFLLRFFLCAHFCASSSCKINRV